MALPANTATSVGAPFAKLVDLGDTLIGAFGGSIRRQQRNYKTGDPKVKDDGKPMLEEVMHLIAMPGTTAKTGDADRGYETITEGAHVRFAVSGFRWGQVIDQRKELPARAGFAAGTECSGDVYLFRLVGWSVSTQNPDGARRAGFTVVENRIVMRTPEERTKYVLAQTERGGNTNVGKDLEIVVRRPTDDEKRWEQAADELFLSKPWERQAESNGAAAAEGPGPFDDAPPEEPF